MVHVIQILFIIYGVVTLFAIKDTNAQIDELYKLCNKQAYINKGLNEKAEMLSKRISATDKLMGEVGISLNRLLQSHKSWTYEQITDLMSQVDALQEQINEMYIQADETHAQTDETHVQTSLPYIGQTEEDSNES